MPQPRNDSHSRRVLVIERSLDAPISHLWKRLEREGRNAIQTVRGIGYQFAPTAEANL